MLHVVIPVLCRPIVFLVVSSSGIRVFSSESFYFSFAVIYDSAVPSHCGIRSESIV